MKTFQIGLNLTKNYSKVTIQHSILIFGLLKMGNQATWLPTYNFNLQVGFNAGV